MTPGQVLPECPIQLLEHLVSRASTAGSRFTNAEALSSPEHALPEHMCLECQSDVSRVLEYLV
ncbi:hypothetical protein AMTR_s00065p00147620 [Amborella trichopoda]|uniref:Uncharacterized protein n=1 Tax=Amborella trichopoda TaxID=13333 RepID=U5D8S0_AMBTC|nr:hypothetical protein AMTR_s00065p00147620 [Amborella trichopoda]